MTDPTTEHDEPVATTAGDEDHEDPQLLRGEDTDPPTDGGTQPVLT